AKLAHQGEKEPYTIGLLQVNTDRHEVAIAGEPVALSPKEYKLLLYLIEHRGRVVSRTQLLSAVWGIDYDNNTNVVDVYISYLRAKIEKEGNKFIQTVKGAGYL